MKTYKIVTLHTVFIDSYENGEGKQVNFYQLDSTRKAETPREAIEQHFNNSVYLPFEFDSAEKDEDKTTIFWSNLVDENNEEPSAHDIEKWKQGERELYSNQIQITAYELTPVKFD